MSCSWDYVTRSTANIAYNYCLLGFEFIQPVSMIAASYIGIVVSVRRQAGEMRDLQTGDQEGLTSAEDREQRKLQREKHKQERKLAKMAALMIALFIGSWLPYALVATFGIVGLDQLVTPYSAELPVMLAKASAIWNPIVYALKHPRYRLALAERLPQWVTAKCCRRAQGDSQTSSTTRRSCVSQSQKPSAEPIAAQSTADRVDLQVRQQIPAIVAASDDGGGNDTDVM